MKTLAIASLALLGAITSVHAGSATVSSGKAAKDLQQPAMEVCFKEHEFQVDLFGQYSVGNGGHVGAFSEHGWGGGIGLNYYFTRNFGLGVDAAWLSIKEDPTFASSSGDKSGDVTALHTFTGSLIWRFPIDHLCLAPYVYAGGGFLVDGRQWAAAHGGAGLEYRIKPDHYGLFVDARWTYLGDRDGLGDLNFFNARLGVRIIF
jgi:hypothetical protein